MNAPTAPAWTISGRLKPLKTPLEVPAPVTYSPKISHMETPPKFSVPRAERFGEPL